MRGASIIIFLLSMFTFILQAKDLRIIKPRIFINTQKEPISYEFKGEQKTKYLASVSFFIINEGKTIYYLPTKIVGGSIITGEKDTEFNKKYTGTLLTIPNNTTVITLNTTNNMHILEDKAKNIPKASIIYPESDFKIAELRPGEAVWIEYKIKLELPQKSREFIFEYLSENIKNRYNFWDGKIISSIYSCTDINLNMDQIFTKLKINM